MKNPDLFKKIVFNFGLCLLLVFVSPASFAQKIKEKINKREMFGGKESSLQEKTVKEIKLISDPNAKVSPGSTIGIGMIATLDDGKEMRTRGYADGKVKWGNYVVKVDGGVFDDGYIKVHNDPRKINGNKVNVKVALYSDSARFQSMDFTVGYKAAYIADYSGKDGREGKIGAIGKAGIKGTSDYGPNAHAGNGSDGEDGGTGETGEDGEPGETVDVFMTAFKNQAGETLLKVYITSKSKQHEDFYIIDPNGGGLTINLKGGNGGTGGWGQQAGPGGSGGDANNNDGHGGDGGDGGNCGNGGNGGNGANGGSATIYVDPSASAYLSLIKCENPGGKAGSAGAGCTTPMAGGGSGGSGKTPGRTGRTGVAGKNGQPGRSAGQQGPLPVIITQAVNIDWDKAGMK